MEKLQETAKSQISPEYCFQKPLSQRFDKAEAFLWISGLIMPDEAEKIKMLIEFKKRVEKKVGDLESELKELQTTLEAVNTILLDKGFKRAEISKTSPVPDVPLPIEDKTQPFSEVKEIISLRAVSGELLATLYADDNSLHVLVAEDKNFSVNTPPFNQFLVERVLAKMQEKDSELTKNGQLAPEQMFSYEILRDGDNIKEIFVRNLDAERLKELKSSIRWTLEKMYEKIRNPG